MIGRQNASNFHDSFSKHFFNSPCHIERSLVQVEQSLNFYMWETNVMKIVFFLEISYKTLTRTHLLRNEQLLKQRIPK